MSEPTFNEGLADCGQASHARYVIGRCRCDACKAANREYERERRRRKAYGRDGMVDAAPVRARLLALYAAGYTTREVERISGVGHTVQYNIVHRHWRTGSPVTRCKRENAEAIMAVRGRNLTPFERVSAGPAIALVRRWMQAGLSGAEVARVSGVDRQEVYHLNYGDRQLVQWRTLRALVESRDELDARCPRKPRERAKRTKVLKPNSRRLTDGQVRMMRVDRARGDRIADIAARYGVSQSTVSRHTKDVVA
jgi:transposase